MSGKIFPDTLRDKHPMYLNQRNQRIEFWVHFRSQAPSTAGRWALQPVINVLLYENEMEGLLMLTRHSQVNVSMVWLEQEMYYHCTSTASTGRRSSPSPRICSSARHRPWARSRTASTR